MTKMIPVLVWIPKPNKFGCGAIALIIFLIFIYSLYHLIINEEKEMKEKGLVITKYKQGFPNLTYSQWSIPLDDSAKYILSNYKINQFSFQFVINLRDVSIPNTGDFKIYIKRNNDFVLKATEYGRYGTNEYEKYFISNIYIIDPSVPSWKTLVPEDEKANPIDFINKSSMSIVGKFELVEKNEKGVPTGRIYDRFQLPNESAQNTNVTLEIEYLKKIIE